MPIDENKIRLLIFVVLADSLIAIVLSWFVKELGSWSITVAIILAASATVISLYGHVTAQINETRTLFRLFLMTNIVHLFILFSRFQLIHFN